MEPWATGSRAFCQLDLRPIEDDSDNVCEELEDLTSFTKIFECDGIRAHTLRAGQYRVHGKYISFSPTTSLMRKTEDSAMSSWVNRMLSV